MESSTLSSGCLLKHGEYRISGVLGQGGFGITYQAEQVSLGRKVAVKEFFMKEYCEREEATSHVTVPTSGNRKLVNQFRAKFLSEARLIASMSNPHIVRVYDVFEENGTAYYVMEYLGGGSLLDAVKRRGPLSESESLGHIRGVASALSALHTRNKLHLDVKPSNVMLDGDGDAVLIDFGISKGIDSEGHLTSSTPIGVSKGYAPFEQMAHDDESTYSPATDIYSLGATLYYLLTAKTPRDASALLKSFPTDDLDANGVSAYLISAIRKSMSVAKEDRPQSVEEFLGILDGMAKEYDNEETVVSVAEDKSQKAKSGKEKKPVESEKPAESEKQHERKESKEPKPAPSTRRFPRWLFGVLGGLAVVAAAYFSGGRSKQTPSDPDVTVNHKPQEVQASKPEQPQATASSTTGANNGHEWVDLGLSVKWATCNVGASSPSDYGSYFAWGETSPKSEYTWSNLKNDYPYLGDIFLVGFKDCP